MLLAADPALAQGKKKSKRAKAQQTEAAEEQKPEAEAEPEPVEPDTWERPPAEEERPPADQPKPVVEEQVGDGRPWSAALLLGWGFKTDRRAGQLGSDPYGFGAGLRGGYSFDFSLYAGAYFLYYIGSSQEGPGGAFGANAGIVESSASYMHFGLEVGYDAAVGPVILRPSLQLGAALALTSLDGSNRTYGDMVFGPGIVLLYPLDDEFFLGGDVRGQLVTGDGLSALSFFATFGMRF